MEKPRKIEKVWKSKPTVEGAGVHLKRAFGYYQVPQLDPFLLLDDFHSDDPRHYLSGFPGTPTAVLRRSPTSFTGTSITATVWATTEPSLPGTCSG